MMNARLDLYRIFFEVAKNRSFSAAAKKLYITQSAVSQAIRQLEEALEVPLFCRSVRGVTLTGEGEILFEHVSSAMGILATGEERLEKIRNLLSGDLKIAVGDTISKHLLLAPLEKYHTAYPDIKLQIFNRTSREAVAMLRSGRAELAFVNLPLDVEEDIKTVLYQDAQDIFVCGKKYAHLAAEPLTFAHLAQQPLILLERTANSRTYVQQFIQSQGVAIQPEIELGSHDLLLEFAAINLGIACVIENFAQSFLSSGQLVQIHTTPQIPPRGIGVCFLSGVSLSAAAQQFLRILFKEKRDTAGQPDSLMLS